jgi:hypothetical protein
MSKPIMVAWARGLAGVWLLVALAACTPPAGSSGDAVSPLASPSQDDLGPTPAIGSTAAPTPGVLPTQPTAPIASHLSTPMPQGSKVDALVRQMMDDLARRNQVAAESIEVVSVTSDEFPADNLGCPSLEKPPLPMPAIVTGFEILLKVGDQTYAYRARGTQVVFCGER